MKSKTKISTKILIAFCLIFLIASCDKSNNETVNYDGYTYQTVQIGNQIWMKENLRTSKYNNGNSIPSDQDVDWAHGTTGAYAIYKDSLFPDKVKNEAKYGKLYNWHAVNSGNLAPKGWHVATKLDWEILDKFLGNSIAGKKLKTKDTWEYDKDAIGTNETRFSALPGGNRSWGGDTFYDMGKVAYFWTNSIVTCTDTIPPIKYPLSIAMSWDAKNITPLYCYRPNFGMSVRCVKDQK